MIDKYPYTDFHEMNLDWIIKEMKDLIDAWDSYGTSVTAEAHTASDPEVTVTGDLKDGLNFDFGLVQGPRGTTGAQGPQGEQGPAGEGLQILDIYPTLAALQAAHPTGSPGDAYLVGSGGSYMLYIWSTSSSAWSDGGSLTSPSPSSAAPAMDGVAAAGSSLLYARGDHVHPADTSKLDKSGTDGVYAVASGSQVMLSVSDTPVADTLVAYDAVGDLNAGNLNASGDISAVDGTFSGDVAVTGDISCDEINVTTNAILNSAMLTAEVNGTNAYKPIARINNIDPLAINYDAQNIPSIRMNTVEYEQNGSRNTVQPEVFFTDAFTIDSVNYNETRIDMRPATTSKMGGVKIGSGITVAADGTISADAGGGFELDLLWTNASPSTVFAGQTLTIDFTDYSEIIVVTEVATSDGNHFSNLMLKNVVTTLIASNYQSASFPRLNCSFNDSSITFGQSYRGGNANNDSCIPIFIYGIK